MASRGHPALKGLASSASRDATLPQVSGRPDALLRPAPLGTGRAGSLASGSSEPWWLVGGQKCLASAVVAVGMYETGFSRVRRGLLRHDRDDRGAGAGQPVFPLFGGLGPVLGGVERAVADRAPAVLVLAEPAAGVADRQGCFAPPPLPVFRQGGVVGGRSAGDDLVADDAGPGKAVEVGAACAVAEHPAVL